MSSSTTAQGRRRAHDKLTTPGFAMAEFPPFATEVRAISSYLCRGIVQFYGLAIMGEAPINN